MHAIDLIRQFPYAVATGLIIATVCSILGVFVILKRVVFIGIALSEVAACGIAASLMLGLNPSVGAVAVTLMAVALLAYPYELRRIARDAVLGIVFVAASSASLILVWRSGFGLAEVKSVLYGDLILAGPADLRLIICILGPIGLMYLAFVRPILDSFLDRDASYVMGLRPAIWEWLYFILLGLAVAMASKIAGSILVFCYLVVCPAMGLIVSKRFWVVVSISAICAVIGTMAGLFAAFRWDLPANQTACLACCAILVIATAVMPIWRRIMAASIWQGNNGGSHA
ncbi:MAG: metal ABC transporter permease [Sedimentisphaerales bacterium]|nr:metal ABC transporter permease [Sedimentisphaerales bacterium]